MVKLSKVILTGTAMTAVMLGFSGTISANSKDDKILTEYVKNIMDSSSENDMSTSAGYLDLNKVSANAHAKANDGYYAPVVTGADGETSMTNAASLLRSKVSVSFMPGTPRANYTLYKIGKKYVAPADGIYRTNKISNVKKYLKAYGSNATISPIKWDKKTGTLSVDTIVTFKSQLATSTSTGGASSTTPVIGSYIGQDDKEFNNADAYVTVKINYSETSKYLKSSKSLAKLVSKLDDGDTVHYVDNLTINSIDNLSSFVKVSYSDKYTDKSKTDKVSFDQTQYAVQ
jgi:hypothetical protein